MNSSVKDKCCNSGVYAYGAAIIGVFLIVGALVWAMYYFTQPPPLGEDRAELRRKALRELRADNEEKLNTYGWQDQAKGIVRLPIAESMKLVETEWGKNASTARSNLIAREEKATFVPPPPPAKPSIFE